MQIHNRETAAIRRGYIAHACGFTNTKASKIAILLQLHEQCQTASSTHVIYGIRKADDEGGEMRGIQRAAVADNRRACAKERHCY